MSPLIICRIQFRCLVLIIVNKEVLLPVLTPHLTCALSNWSSPSYAISSFQRLPILWCSPFSESMFLHTTRSHFKSVFSPFFPWGIFILLNPPLGNSFLLEKASFSLLSRGVNPGGWGWRPAYFGQGGRVGIAGGSLASWTGREIVLYLIMYRKYVRKWLLLKRNKIIWPEVAVNVNFLAWKINF